MMQLTAMLSVASKNGPTLRVSDKTAAFVAAYWTAMGKG